MSTSGTFTFTDNVDSYHVYVHWDCYPTGAAEYLEATLQAGKVWELPRFEADEFSAGFVATVKNNGGNVRLVNGTIEQGNHDYDYHVFKVNHELSVSVSSGGIHNVLFIGSLKDFIERGAALLEE